MGIPTEKGTGLLISPVHDDTGLAPNATFDDSSPNCWFNPHRVLL